MPLPLPIATARTTLRPFTDNDVDDLLDYHARPGVARYLLKGPLDRAGVIAKIERHRTQIGLDTDARAVAVAVEYEGSVVGDVGIWLLGETNERAEIGWVFSPEVAGRGWRPRLWRPSSTPSSHTSRCTASKRRWTVATMPPRACVSASG